MKGRVRGRAPSLAGGSSAAGGVGLFSGRRRGIFDGRRRGIFGGRRRGDLQGLAAGDLSGDWRDTSASCRRGMRSSPWRRRAAAGWPEGNRGSIGLRPFAPLLVEPNRSDCYFQVRVGFASGLTRTLCKSNPIST
jgi:hypothetical protein